MDTSTYARLGLKIGLEIHRQLDMTKLFCDCPSELKDDYRAGVERQLRPTQSELGDVDQAALAEARRQLRFRYQVTANTCLVELDEEPPHEPNPQAITMALMVAKLLDATPVDEIEFMRKIVIDGSNTAGFQRTALVAYDGKLDGISIDTICVEEDAARKIEADEDVIIYRLDRLGIPLIEIATAPQITTPEAARTVAERLGMVLRSTGLVKRGLGTVRQDLNVSIREGARVEVKGVQDLRAIPAVIETEIVRQLNLIDIKNQLITRHAKLEDRVYELTAVFKDTKCELIRQAMKGGKVVLGLKLSGFAGLLEGEKGIRLGGEFAGLIKSIGIAGLFHSDELPGYGITAQEIANIARTMALTDEDAFVLIAEREPLAMNGLAFIFQRAQQCSVHVPKEVRNALADNTTSYMRPLPGGARMYPETDVKPIRITDEHLATIQVPELLTSKVARFARDYKMSEANAYQLISQGYDEDFERLVSRHGMANVVARTFLNTLPELADEGLVIDGITISMLDELFSALSAKRFAKEGVNAVLSHVLKHDATVEEAIVQTGIALVSRAEVERLVDEILATKHQLIAEKGDRAFSALMGLAMNELRGQADGKLIAQVLKRKLGAVNNQ